MAPAAPGIAASSATNNACKPPWAPAPIAGRTPNTIRAKVCTNAGSFQLDHQTIADGDAAVHLCGDVEVVGGDDGGEAGCTHQLPERAEHVIGGAHIEITGWLVAEQDARRIGNCARYRHALLLAARQFRGPMGQ